MSNPYIDNADRWLSLADIDYLTQFVKAWIPFNAWYQNMYPRLRRDRDIINEIKTNSNLFRDKLIALLNGSDNASVLFKSHISTLDCLLEQHYLPNADKRISFRSITVERNPLTVKNHTFRRWNYKVEINYSNNNNYTVNSLVTDSNGTTQYTFNQTSYNINEILNHAESTSSLNESQRNALRMPYESIDPKKPISLIVDSNRNSIQAGSIYLIDDTDKLVKGIIEILYRLRNILFHGELIPSQDNKQVYEPAYNILKTLIQSLK